MTRTVRDQNADVDPQAVSLRGKVQRMVISLTSKALWQVAGYTLGRLGEQQVLNTEPFNGIGLFARPASSGKPECVVVMTGNDGKSPVIVAVRDERTRAKVAGALGIDETMLFNSKVCIHLKADGTWEARSATPANPVEALPRFETYRTAEDDLWTHVSLLADDLSTFIAAQNTYNLQVQAAVDALAGSGVLGPAITPGKPAFVITAAAVVIEGAIVIFDGFVTAFKAAAANYLSNVGRNE